MLISNNPFLWAESRFSSALSPELMALYNPARMIAEYKLIPMDYADYHIVALEEQAVLEAATMFYIVSDTSWFRR